MLKVMIATDGSPNSEQTVDFAQTLLAGKEVETIVFHVMPRHVSYGVRAPVVLETYDLEHEKKECSEMLEATAQRLRESGVGPSIREVLATGDPADVILAEAERENTDLIIMGRRGLNAAERFLLGGVSSKVSSHAHCSVLVVHHKDRSGKEQ